MNLKTEKQARLDAFEIINKWPELDSAGFWRVDLLTEARRASRSLYDSDVNECTNRDDVRAQRRLERAYKRAKKALYALSASLVDAFSSQGVAISPDFVRISFNGFGFRFIELNGRGNRYNLID